MDRAALRAELRRVSIRGRMAFAVSCIESAVDVLGQRTPQVDRLIDFLWEFVETDDLGWWDARWMALEPVAGLHPTIHEMVEIAAEDVARGNLFAGVVGASEATLAGAEAVAEVAVRIAAPLPPADRFTGSAFTERHGFGLSRPRSYFFGPPPHEAG